MARFDDGYADAVKSISKLDDWSRNGLNRPGHPMKAIIAAVEARDGALCGVRYHLHLTEIRVGDVKKLSRDCGPFILITNKGNINLGDASCLQSFAKCRAAISNKTGVVLPRSMRKEWPLIAKFIKDAAGFANM